MHVVLKLKPSLSASSLSTTCRELESRLAVRLMSRLLKSVLDLVPTDLSSLSIIGSRIV
jgi:hypothetical protein